MREVLIRAVVASLALLGLAALVIDWNELIRPGGVRYTNDAQLDGNLTQLKAQVAGNLVEVPVIDYSRVKRGDLLFRIDDSDYRARAGRAGADVAQAEAAVAAAEATLTQQIAQIDVAKAKIRGDEAGLELARQERARQAALLHTESYLARAWQDALANEHQQQAMVGGDRRALKAQEEQVEGARAQVSAQRATLSARRASLASAEVQLGYTRISAPFDGIVTARLARLGEYVSSGTALITIVPIGEVWAVANYREVQLAKMRSGQHARITVDAVPGTVFTGRVDSIGPLSQAEGSAMPPDRATGNFTMIVQRVPVKVLLDVPAGLAERLRPGLSVEVDVDTAGGVP